MKQLGDPSLSIRLGGIYAPERIAEDSERDRETIHKLLCAYLRENSPVNTDESVANPPMSADSAAAAAVVANVSQLAVPGSSAFRVYFEVDLRRTNLSGARLGHAEFYGADLTGADLTDADLQGAELSHATLNEVRLNSANLRGAQLRGTELDSAELRQANLFSSHLRHATLKNADLTGADLRQADLYMADVTKANLAGADVGEAVLIKANFSGAIVTGVKQPRRNVRRLSGIHGGLNITLRK